MRLKLILGVLALAAVVIFSARRSISSPAPIVAGRD
jgi:hypothetical protein